MLERILSFILVCNRANTCSFPQEKVGSNSPNVDTVGTAKTDDLRSGRCLDQVVNFTIWNQILVAWILREEREFELCYHSEPRC